jgi:hypothetical protein
MPLLPLLAAAAAVYTVNVPDSFGDRIDKVGDKSGVAVLLPETIPSYRKKVYPSSFATKDEWSLDLGVVKNCNGANACGLAYFGGRETGKPSGDEPIKLAKGKRGFFTTTHCGASCAPPQIMWRQRGDLYFVQIKGLGEADEKPVLRKAVNSAIRHGDRAH